MAVFGGRNGGQDLDFGNRVLERFDGPGSALLVIPVHAIFEDADGAAALSRQVIGAEIAAVSVSAAGHTRHQVHG